MPGQRRVPRPEAHRPGAHRPRSRGVVHARGRRSPRMQLMLALSLAAPAEAAEVVWLGETPPDPAVWRGIAVQAGARGPALSIDDLRSAATMVGPDDDIAYANLDKALKAVRAYETRLDGELLIMDEL